MKKKLPAEVLKYFQETGREGGKAEVAKGFAKMSPEKRKAAMEASLKTRKKNALKKKDAAK